MRQLRESASETANASSTPFKPNIPEISWRSSFFTFLYISLTRLYILLVDRSTQVICISDIYVELVVATPADLLFIWPFIELCRNANCKSLPHKGVPTSCFVKRRLCLCYRICWYIIWSLGGSPLMSKMLKVDRFVSKLSLIVMIFVSSVILLFYIYSRRTFANKIRSKSKDVIWLKVLSCLNT